MLHTQTRRFGLIGFGAIGAEIAALVNRLGEADRLTGVLVRPGHPGGQFHAVHDAEALAASGAKIVLECASHAGVRQHVPSLLRLGVDVVLSSIGALCEGSLAVELQHASSGGGRLLMAAGAIGGLDALLAARLSGFKSVSYVSVKPPSAWRGTPAEASCDLDADIAQQVVFDGTARQAALLFPRNANVAAAVALCSLGFDRTRTKLIASRDVTDPLGIIEAEGACGRFRYETFAFAAPSNPKTSLLTANSLLQCARLGQGAPLLPLLADAAS